MGVAEAAESASVSGAEGSGLSNRTDRAAHFQNKRIPADYACYACHSDYTMFGDVDDKIRGVRHVWHNVWGMWSEPVALYEPSKTRPVSNVTQARARTRSIRTTGPICVSSSTVPSHA